MNDFDIAVHYRILAHFVEHGVAPNVSQLAQSLNAGAAEIEASLATQAQGRALNLFPGSNDIRMAHPFSAVPTPFRVCSAGGCWWPNCAWCALGIPAMLHRDASVFTVCAHCQRPITWRVQNGAISGDDAIVHFVVPAARWWDDVARTCGTILAFDSREHLEVWLGEQPMGAIVPRDQLWALSQAWYGDRFDPQWRPKTPKEANATLVSVGLEGDFWTL